MYVRRTARNKELLCGIKCDIGGTTKGFTIMDELAQYIHSEYGERRQRYLRVKRLNIHKPTLAEHHARKTPVYAPGL